MLRVHSLDLWLQRPLKPENVWQKEVSTLRTRESSMGHLPRKYLDIKLNGQAMSAVGCQVIELELPNPCKVERIHPESQMLELEWQD